MFSPASHFLLCVSAHLLWRPVAGNAQRGAWDKNQRGHVGSGGRQCNFVRWKTHQGASQLLGGGLEDLPMGK